ncbi:MAG: hypothetical protein AAFV19_03470 [Pseudomonadota bacterium]
MYAPSYVQLALPLETNPSSVRTVGFLDIVGTSAAHTLAAFRLMAADDGMAAAQQLLALVFPH